jgi:hypothetical protein
MDELTEKSTGPGKRIVDIGQLVDVFEAQEGEIQHIIGKTGNGKTYEGTRRALEFLKQGYIVYTTWQLILPEYYDEREDREKIFWRTLFFRKRFYKINYKKNWHWLDIDRPDLIQFVAGLTDCIVFLDEGQDIFDSRERIDKASRKVLTRTRHMRKTLIIISQRAQAVDVTARANVTYYYKCVKTWAWFFPFKTYFKVYRTEEMDQVNFPIWEDPATEWEAEVWQSHFASNEVFNAFNSWYLRAGVPKSQEIYFEAYELTLWDKIKAFLTKHKRQIAEVDPIEQARMEKINREKYEESIRFDPKPAKRKKPLSDLVPLAVVHDNPGGRIDEEIIV